MRRELVNKHLVHLNNANIKNTENEDETTAEAESKREIGAI